jgi:hypothetical protein
MINTTQTTIDIKVVCSRSYDQVTASLQRLGSFADPAKFRSQLSAGASWAQIEKTIEGMLGSSGLSVFHKVEHGDLLSLLARKATARKPVCHWQSAAGGPHGSTRTGSRFVCSSPAGNVRGRQKQMGCCLRSIHFPSGAISTCGHCLDRKLVEQKVDALVAEVPGEGAKLHRMNGSHRCAAQKLHMR